MAVASCTRVSTGMSSVEPVSRPTCWTASRAELSAGEPPRGVSRRDHRGADQRAVGIELGTAAPTAPASPHRLLERGRGPHPGQRGGAARAAAARLDTVTSERTAQPACGPPRWHRTPAASAEAWSLRAVGAARYSTARVMSTDWVTTWQSSASISTVTEALPTWKPSACAMISYTPGTSSPQ